MASQSSDTAAPDRPRLRRSLRRWQVVGLSVGLMGPSMAISINPQGAVGDVGRAVPLTFVIALFAALLVAYGFARLSQDFHHPGSVIGLVGATLGPVPGVLAGWALAGCYTTFAFIAAVTAGINSGVLYGTWTGRPVPNWFVVSVAAVVLAGTALLAAVPAARVTDVLLSVEGVTVALIVAAATVVVVRLAGHSGPGHLRLSAQVFVPARGTGVSEVFLGVVFGLLSFAGFEAAAALGGEARRPRRDIPFAILGATAAVGVFYVVISAVEVLGFGTSRAGLADFAASPALLGTLGQRYLSSWFGDLIILGTVASAFGCCLASCTAASRLVFSFARDGVGAHHRLARLSPRWATPVPATVAVTAVNLVVLAVLDGIVGAAPLSVFEWVATVGTFLILLAYLLVGVGAVNHLFVAPWRRGLPTRVRPLEAAVPVAGIVLIVYTYDRNVSPYPTGALAWLPAVAGAWMAVAVALVLLRPALARRLGARLLADAGTAGAGSDTTSGAGGQPAEGQPAEGPPVRSSARNRSRS